MISNGRPVDLHQVEKVIHDFARTDERRRFNASLELISGIQVDNVASVFIFDDVDESPRVGSPPY